MKATINFTDNTQAPPIGTFTVRANVTTTEQEPVQRTHLIYDDVFFYLQVDTESETRLLFYEDDRIVQYLRAPLQLIRPGVECRVYGEKAVQLHCSVVTMLTHNASCLDLMNRSLVDSGVDKHYRESSLYRMRVPRHVRTL